MKPINSKLNIIQDALLNYQYEFIADDSIDFDTINLEDVFNNYEIDVDFEFRGRESDFEIVVSTVINKDKSFGYYINMRLATVFSFNEKVTDDKERVHWIQSAIGITINKVREKIIHFTCHCPLVVYNLPLIDLTNLINQKNEIIAKETEATKSEENKKTT